MDELTMSIFYTDDREFKQDVRELIDRTNTTEERVRFSDELQALLSIHPVAIDHDRFADRMAKLVIANNSQRAHKLLSVINDHDIRGWFRVCIWSIGKLFWVAVAIGIVWAGVSMYHCN